MHDYCITWLIWLSLNNNTDTSLQNRCNFFISVFQFNGNKRRAARSVSQAREEERKKNNATFLRGSFFFTVPFHYHFEENLL